MALDSPCFSPRFAINSLLLRESPSETGFAGLHPPPPKLLILLLSPSIGSPRHFRGLRAKSDVFALRDERIWPPRRHSWLWSLGRKLIFRGLSGTLSRRPVSFEGETSSTRPPSQIYLRADADVRATWRGAGSDEGSRRLTNSAPSGLTECGWHSCAQRRPWVPERRITAVAAMVPRAAQLRSNQWA
jgi:hypothetical protein